MKLVEKSVVIYLKLVRKSVAIPQKPVYKFVGSKNVDNILLNLSAQINGVKFIPGETCLIFDEIQDCPEARTSLKFFYEDGRFDVIATGSLLGVQGYGDEARKRRRKLIRKEDLGINSVPVGSEDIIGMYPRDDMVKYAPDKDKPHIRECFNSIPKQLAKDNKKFQYSMVKPGGRSETYLGALQWLEDAGIICRCYNTDITGLPMEGNAKDNVFKVYTADIGILIEMLGPGTRADILQGNLGGFKGAIYENLMADTLHKKNQSLYYFQKDSGLELDFLVRMKGECVPLEVKARTAQAKSAQTVLKHPEKYGVKQIIKFGDYNVGRKGQLLTLPLYMQFLLDLEPEEIILEPINADAVNAMAKEILNP